jgi:hypothetical protein
MYFRSLTAVIILVGLCNSSSAQLARPPSAIPMHYLWEIHGMDELSTTSRVFRRYGYEGDTARNLLILSCPADPAKKIHAEIIPPRFLLKDLNSLTGGGTKTASIEIVGGGGTLKASDDIDPIAAFMDIADSELAKATNALGYADIQIGMFDGKLTYKLLANKVASQQIAAMLSSQKAKQDLGGARFLSSPEVANECMQFRRKR